MTSMRSSGKLFNVTFVALLFAFQLHAAPNKPVNGVMMQAFHWYLPADGKHWQRVASHAKDCAGLVTAFWIPPAHKGMGGIYDVGYGTKDLYDLGEFNQAGSTPTKYGTLEDLRAAREEARKAGIHWYMDIVYNQMMGAEKTELVQAVEVNPENREEVKDGPRDIEAFVRFENPARAGKYSSYVFTRDDFNGVDWDNIRKEPGRIYRFAHKNWNRGVSGEKNGYDFLIGANLDMDHPPLVAELVKHGQWLVDFLQPDGFRLDAVKHIEAEFVSHWLDQVRSKKPEIFSVAEYLSPNVNEIRAYLDATKGKTAVFDFALRNKFRDASHGSGFFDMRTLLNDTMVADPGLAPFAVTLVDNHDTQGGQALAPPVADPFKPLAYAVILLREQGYPCIFYADYFGAEYEENGTKYKIPALKDLLNKFILVRQKYNYGKQRDYFDDPDLVGWTREGDPDRQKSMAVVLNDNRLQAGIKAMEVGAKAGAKNRIFRDVTGNVMNAVTVGEDGRGQFPAAAGSVSVWVEE